MLSKSFSTFKFELGQYEVQVSDEGGQFVTDPVTFAELNEQLGVMPDSDLTAGADGRLSVTQFFPPDFSFRSPVLYRLRNTNEDGRFLVGSTLQTGTEWVELDSNTFRRVQLRPVKDVGLGNFANYFSTPALFKSIQNSLVIALISTVVTVTLAFGFAYALSRSCMRFKGAFKLIAMAPILVPSLLPGIALVYLFGNQGMLKELLFGASIYGPIGIVIGSVFFTFPHAFSDYFDGLGDFRYAPLRSGRISPRKSVAHVLDRDDTGRALWPDLGGVCRVQPCHYRFWFAQSDRRPVQCAGGRHLQTGDWPAEF